MTLIRGIIEEKSSILVDNPAQPPETAAINRLCKDYSLYGYRKVMGFVGGDKNGIEMVGKEAKSVESRICKELEFKVMHEPSNFLTHKKKLLDRIVYLICYFAENKQTLRMLR